MPPKKCKGIWHEDAPSADDAPSKVTKSSSVLMDDVTATHDGKTGRVHYYFKFTSKCACNNLLLKIRVIQFFDWYRRSCKRMFNRTSFNWTLGEAGKLMEQGQLVVGFASSSQREYRWCASGRERWFERATPLLPTSNNNILLLLLQHRHVIIILLLAIALVLLFDGGDGLIGKSSETKW